jgi:hypothetical protein
MKMKKFRTDVEKDLPYTTKKFRMDMEKDLPHMLDAIFVGNHDHEPNGWVIMDVNAKGRDCVNALFPGAQIAWREPSDAIPADWHGFEIHVPGVVEAIQTKLPLWILPGADLHEANPDALAFLIAIGVIHQGARAAIFRNGRLEIFQSGDRGLN